MTAETRVENLGASPTRRESIPTRIESNASAKSKTKRLHIPDAVASRYEYLYDLPASGGEADTALLEDRETGLRFFFKFYRTGVSPDPMAMLLLKSADPAHVVRLVDFHDDDDGTWEIQEYCELGSMQDWVGSLGGKLTKDVLLETLREITAALEYLHGLGSGIAHRDLKPANVLVRHDKPLDLVLADFGLAKSQQAFTHLTTTVKGTWHYSAPEVHSKISTPKSDWFSLGAMLYEFYTGQKLFAMADGTEVSEDDARARCLSHSYSTSLVDDARWRLLLDGLLTWDKDCRWGASEIRRWLAGESPEVNDNQRNTGAAPTARIRYRPTWSPTLVSTPQELADLYRENWDDAAKSLAGRPDPQLVSFLEEFPDADTAKRVLSSNENPELKLVRLQAILDPAGPINFRQFALDDESLQKSIRLARNGNKTAIRRLEDIRKLHVLRAYSEVTGSQNAANADFCLEKWDKQAQALIETLPQEQAEIGKEAYKAALADLFVAAFEEEN